MSNLLRLAVIQHAEDDYDVQVGDRISQRLFADEALAVVARALYSQRAPGWLQSLEGATQHAIQFGWRIPTLIPAIATPALEAPKAVEAAKAEDSDLLAACEAILSHPNINLGDLIYDVREREGKGWDGPNVEAWAKAVMALKAAVAKREGGAA